MRCDLAFFVRDHPSHGMGIEAQIAADMLIPWGDAKVAGEASKLCPLLAGLANAESDFRFYFNVDNVGEFAGRLRKRLQDPSLRQRLEAAQRDRRLASAVVRRIGIGTQLRRQRLLLNLSAAELGHLVDLDPWWIISIENDAELSDCLTFMQLLP